MLYKINDNVNEERNQDIKQEISKKKWWRKYIILKELIAVIHQ